VRIIAEQSKFWVPNVRTRTDHAARSRSKACRLLGEKHSQLMTPALSCAAASKAPLPT